MSDRVTFNECAKKSRQQKVTLVENITFLSQWYVSRYLLFPCFEVEEILGISWCRKRKTVPSWDYFWMHFSFQKIATNVQPPRISHLCRQRKKKVKRWQNLVWFAQYCVPFLRKHLSINALSALVSKMTIFVSATKNICQQLEKKRKAWKRKQNWEKFLILLPMSKGKIAINRYWRNKN